MGSIERVMGNVMERPLFGPWVGKFADAKVNEGIRLSWLEHKGVGVFLHDARLRDPRLSPLIATYTLEWSEVLPVLLQHDSTLHLSQVAQWSARESVADSTYRYTLELARGYGIETPDLVFKTIYFATLCYPACDSLREQVLTELRRR